MTQHTIAHEFVFDRIIEAKQLSIDINQEVYLVGDDLDVVPSSKYIPGDNRLIYHVVWPLRHPAVSVRSSSIGVSNERD